MAKLSIQAGATSQTVNVFIQDSSSSTGAGLSGLVYNSSGLTAYYALPRAASVQITLATLAAVTSAFSSGGFKEIDATNMKGWYRLDLPDAAIASGRFSSVHLQGATNMAPLALEIELTGWNNQDAVRGGLTALPNANAEAAGGLYTRGTGAGQIKQTNNGEIDANVAHINNVSTSPVTTVKAVQGLTTADTIATYTGNTPQTGDAYARLGAPAGASVSADIAAVPTATQNADALLKRDMGAVAGEAARSPLNALRWLRNKWSIAGGTLTVTKEDDTTAAWTSAVVTTPGDPVSSSDPA